MCLFHHFVGPTMLVPEESQIQKMVNFLLDLSYSSLLCQKRWGKQSGYLHDMCETLYLVDWN